MSKMSVKIGFKSFQWKEGRRCWDEGTVLLEVNGKEYQATSDKDWSGKIVVYAQNLERMAGSLGVELDWSKVAEELEKIYAERARERAEKEHQEKVQRWEHRWTAEAAELVKIWEPDIIVEEHPKTLEEFLKISAEPSLYLQKGDYSKRIVRGDDGFFCMQDNELHLRRYKRLETAVQAFRKGLEEHLARKARESRQRQQLEVVKEEVNRMFPEGVEKSVSRDSCGVVSVIVGMETDGRYRCPNFHFSACVIGDEIEWRFQGVKVSAEQLVKFYNELSAIYAENKRRS